MNTCSVAGSTSVVTFSHLKNGSFISILQIKAAETQGLRSSPRVSHPQNGEVEAEAHFCPQSSCLFCHIFHSPTITRFAAGLGLRAGTVRNCSGHMAAGERARGSSFRCLDTFTLTGPSYVSVIHSQLRSLNRRLLDLCLHSHHCALPS